MKKEPVDYGALNAYIIGDVMRNTVRRAIDIIRAKRMTFIAKTKPSSSGKKDFVTDADIEAQKMYAGILRKYFPHIGIIGEEKNLSMRGKGKYLHWWFTVDPLDGTRAYTRRESDGIGTMISLVADGSVIAAYVGNPLTEEIFGFRPESTRVHRITSFGNSTILKVNPDLPLAKQRLLIRETHYNYSNGAQGHINSTFDGGLFKDYSTSSGSIGITFTRLWKGEVGGILLPIGPGGDMKETPWDNSPIIGISKVMGFKFYNVDPHIGTFKEFDPRPERKTVLRHHEVLVVHKSRSEEIEGIVE